VGVAHLTQKEKSLGASPKSPRAATASTSPYGRMRAASVRSTEVIAQASGRRDDHRSRVTNGKPSSVQAAYVNELGQTVFTDEKAKHRQESNAPSEAAGPRRHTVGIPFESEIQSLQRRHTNVTVVAPEQSASVFSTILPVLATGVVFILLGLLLGHGHRWFVQWQRIRLVQGEHDHMETMREQRETLIREQGA